MRVKPETLRKLASKLQQSVVSGALEESANYIEILERELSDLKIAAELVLLNYNNMMELMDRDIL